MMPKRVLKSLFKQTDTKDMSFIMFALYNSRKQKLLFKYHEELAVLIKQ